MIFVSLIVDMQPCLGRVIVGSEGFQIHENWGLDGPKIMKNRDLEGLGVALGAFWRSLAKLWPGFLRKLSPGGTQDRLGLAMLPPPAHPIPSFPALHREDNTHSWNTDDRVIKNKGCPACHVNTHLER